jgi:hypothetical protein
MGAKERGQEVMILERIICSENRLLAALRSIVLERNAKTRRLPKWRFRIGDDLVMQLQPQSPPLLFEGRVIQGQNIPVDAFKGYGRGFSCMHFRLSTQRSGTSWEFYPTLFPSSTDEFHALRARVLTALEQLEQLDASMMFQPACLACGKKLIDAVSQARWFGPECASTTSLDVRSWRVPTPEAA